MCQHVIVVATLCFSFPFSPFSFSLLACKNVIQLYSSHYVINEQLIHWVDDSISLIVGQFSHEATDRKAIPKTFVSHGILRHKFFVRFVVELKRASIPFNYFGKLVSRWNSTLIAFECNLSRLIDKVIISNFRLVERTLSCTIYDAKYRRSFSEIRYLPSAARYSATENITRCFHANTYCLDQTLDCGHLATCIRRARFLARPWGPIKRAYFVTQSTARFFLCRIPESLQTAVCRCFNILSNFKIAARVLRIIGNNWPIIEILSHTSLCVCVCICKFHTDLRQRNNATRTRSSTSIYS